MCSMPECDFFKPSHMELGSLVFLWGNPALTNADGYFTWCTVSLEYPNNG